MTCKGTQQVRLLLQVIQSMLQHVANADHADQPVAFFDGQMTDVAGEHGRRHIRNLVAWGTCDHGPRHEGRYRQVVDVCRMQVHTERDIPFRDYTLNRRSVATYDRGTNAPLAKTLRERSDRVGGLDGHNCGTLDRKNARYVHDAAPATDERLPRSFGL